jgi:hypothetical protein
MPVHAGLCFLKTSSCARRSHILIRSVFPSVSFTRERRVYMDISSRRLCLGAGRTPPSVGPQGNALRRNEKANP